MDNLTEFTQHIEAAVQAGQKPIELVPGDYGVRLELVPPGYTAKIADLEEYGPGPRRKKGHPRFDDVQSFYRYLAIHKEPGTQVYLYEGEFAAIINGHSKDAAGWGDHTAHYLIKATEPWAAWMAMSHAAVSQQDFAIFLDARMSEIAIPDGADLAEVVTNLTVKQNVDFQSKVNLQNGAAFLTYVENLEQGGGVQGTMRLPSNLTLQMGCYEGMDAETIEAKLRWRFNNGKVLFGIEFGDEIRRVREAAEQQAVADIEANTGLTVWKGSAS